MQIVVNGNISQEKLELCLAQIRENFEGLLLDKIVITAERTGVVIDVVPVHNTYSKMGGYFIGDPNSWNEAKRAEYNDRVIHTLD